MTAEDVVRQVLDQAEPGRGADLAAAIVKALRAAGLLADAAATEETLRPDELNAHNDI